MSIGRILDYKVVAKDVIMGHCSGAGIEGNEPLLKGTASVSGIKSDLKAKEARLDNVIGRLSINRKTFSCLST